MMSVRPALEVAGELFDGVEIRRDRGGRKVPPLEFLQHDAATMGHKTPPVIRTLPRGSSAPHAERPPRQRLGPDGAVSSCGRDRRLPRGSGHRARVRTPHDRQRFRALPWPAVTPPARCHVAERPSAGGSVVGQRRRLETECSQPNLGGGGVVRQRRLLARLFRQRLGGRLLLRAMTAENPLEAVVGLVARILVDQAARAPGRQLHRPRARERGRIVDRDPI